MRRYLFVLVAAGKMQACQTMSKCSIAHSLCHVSFSHVCTKLNFEFKWGLSEGQFVQWQVDCLWHDNLCWYWCFQGIEWIHVEYFNNAVICELIEKVRTDVILLWTRGLELACSLFLIVLFFLAAIWHFSQFSSTSSFVYLWVNTYTIVWQI